MLTASFNFSNSYFGEKIHRAFQIKNLPGTKSIQFWLSQDNAIDLRIEETYKWVNHLNHWYCIIEWMSIKNNHPHSNGHNSLFYNIVILFTEITTLGTKLSSTLVWIKEYGYLAFGNVQSLKIRKQYLRPTVRVSHFRDSEILIVQKCHFSSSGLYACVPILRTPSATMTRKFLNIPKDQNIIIWKRKVTKIHITKFLTGRGGVVLKFWFSSK